MTTSGGPPADDPVPPNPAGQPPVAPPDPDPAPEPWAAQPYPTQPYPQQPYAQQSQPTQPYATQPYPPGPIAPAGYPGSQAALGYGPPPGALPPDNYLVWAILSTVLCCLPLGIVSIVFAAQVNDKWARGDVAGATEASTKAKQFAIWSVVAYVGLAVVGIVLYVGFFAVLFGAGVATSP